MNAARNSQLRPAFARRLGFNPSIPVQSPHASAPVIGRPLLVQLLLIPSLLLAALVAPAPSQAADDTLPESIQWLRQFPFRPDCDGNTQEVVACLWQQRNQADARLQRLLGGPALLELWRSSRRQVCDRAGAKVAGGSLEPIVRLSCENTLNTNLIQQITQSLTR